jgi:hypothetical protein
MSRSSRLAFVAGIKPDIVAEALDILRRTCNVLAQQAA